MQRTRQKILEYLRDHGSGTVEDLSRALDDLTAVTVRHHLDVLRSEGLVAPPGVERRSTPGRPKYVYRLTDKAQALFPSNLTHLTVTMLAEIKNTLPPEKVNVFFDGVAGRMAADLPSGPPGETFEVRLGRVVEHLSRLGYDATWEATPDGYLLHTSNCPYQAVTDDHEEVCVMDMRFIGNLLGVTPQRVGHRREADPACSYLFALESAG